MTLLEDVKRFTKNPEYRYPLFGVCFAFVVFAVVMLNGCAAEKKETAPPAGRLATAEEAQTVERVLWVAETIKNVAPSPLLPCFHAIMKDFPGWYERHPDREQFMPKKNAIGIRWTAMELYGRYIVDRLRDGTYNKPQMQLIEVRCGPGREDDIIDLNSGATLPKNRADAMAQLKQIRAEFAEISSPIPASLAFEE